MGVPGAFPRKNRSPVTTVGWVFLIVGGSAALIFLTMNIIISNLSASGQLNSVIENLRAREQMPLPIRLIVFRAYFIVLLAISTITAVAAIGLLVRKNWARFVFVGTMCIGMALNIAGFALQPLFVAAAYPITFYWIIRVYSALVAAAICVGCGWAIKVVMSKESKPEFHG
jgi:hypothetical protein